MLTICLPLIASSTARHTEQIQMDHTVSMKALLTLQFYTNCLARQRLASIVIKTKKSTYNSYIFIQYIAMYQCQCAEPVITVTKITVHKHLNDWESKFYANKSELRFQTSVLRGMISDLPWSHVLNIFQPFALL